MTGAIEAGKTDQTLRVRPATPADIARITEIYNHYVINTHITFDLEPVTLASRLSWFGEFGASGPHRLLVAEKAGVVVGYAGSHEYRERRAYDTTVETTIYCDRECVGQGIGRRLYAALFEAIAGEDLRLAVAGIALPNPASLRLHERLGFETLGVMHAVGRKFGQYWDVVWMEKPLGKSL